MPDEFLTRAQLVHTRIARVKARADRCALNGDLDGVEAAAAEMDLLFEAMLRVREDQLLAQLPKPKPRRWWQFWRNEEGS